MNISEYFKKIEKNIKKNSNIEIRDLEKIKAKFIIYIDQYLEELYSHTDNIGKLIKKKVDLKEFKVSFLKQFFNLKVRELISAPFIYSMIIPILITDIFLETYHHICFPLYRIPMVKRKNYISYDRHLLSYLNWFEKLNCVYCSYANGLIAYMKEIAARTERYWCPIKHSQKLYDEHSQYHKFNEYLDGKNYHSNLKKLRKF